MNISECCITVLLGLDRHIQPYPHVCSGFFNPLRADSVDLAYITPVCDVSYKRVGLERIAIAFLIQSLDPDLREWAATCVTCHCIARYLESFIPPQVRASLPAALTASPSALKFRLTSSALRVLS